LAGATAPTRPATVAAAATSTTAAIVRGRCPGALFLVMMLSFASAAARVGSHSPSGQWPERATPCGGFCWVAAGVVYVLSIRWFAAQFTRNSQFSLSSEVCDLRGANQATQLSERVANSRIRTARPEGLLSEATGAGPATRAPHLGVGAFASMLNWAEVRSADPYTCQARCSARRQRWRLPLRHRLGPRDMSFEAKRSRHVAVAIPESCVSPDIALSPCQ
jgi:hypothetical protein